MFTARFERTMNNMNKETKPENRSGQVPVSREAQIHAVIKIAVDVHLKTYTVGRQVDNSAPQPPQRMPREKFVQWAGGQKQLAREVHVCYEAGCFGFGLARELIAIGVKAHVIAPRDWSDSAKAKSDKSDTRAMLRHLDQWLNGNTKALSVVRIPSVEQEQRRAESRLREQMLAHRKALQAQGRSLLLLSGVSVRGRWWAPRPWALLKAKLDAVLASQLEVLRSVILAANQQVNEHTLRLEKAVGTAALPRGLGAMSCEIMDREIMDYGRFKNSRQVGSYFGMCPGEDSSGPRRRMLSITKHGNPRLRCLVVEAVWRFLQFQPEYWAIKKWRAQICQEASPAMRKKAVIAVARNLACDLWKLKTGRARAGDLGIRMNLVPNAAGELPAKT